MLDTRVEDLLEENHQQKTENITLTVMVQNLEKDKMISEKFIKCSKGEVEFLEKIVKQKTNELENEKRKNKNNESAILRRYQNSYLKIQQDKKLLLTKIDRNSWKHDIQILSFEKTVEDLKEQIEQNNNIQIPKLKQSVSQLKKNNTELKNQWNKYQGEINKSKSEKGRISSLKKLLDTEKKKNIFYKSIINQDNLKKSMDSKFKKMYEDLKKEIRELLVCSIILDKIKIPAITPSGNLIEEKFLAKLVAEKRCDPFNSELIWSQVIINRFAKDVIEILDSSVNTDYIDLELYNPSAEPKNTSKETIQEESKDA